MKIKKCDRCKKEFDNKKVGGFDADDKTPYDSFESKVSVRQFFFKQKFKGWEDFSHRIDGFRSAIITRWKDFDLCSECWVKALKFILSEGKYDIVEIKNEEK